MLYISLSVIHSEVHAIYISRFFNVRGWQACSPLVSTKYNHIRIRTLCCRRTGCPPPTKNCPPRTAGPRTRRPP